MSNINQAFGFRRVGSYGVSGGMPSRKYVIPASDGTATFRGDAVITSDGYDSTTGDGLVVQAAATNPVRGVIEGFTWPANSLPAFNVVNRLASTRVPCIVCDDPSAMFEVQSNGTDDVGENEDFAVGAGSTTTGASGMYLNSGSNNTTSKGCRVLGYMRRADNSFSSTYAKVLVMFNQHEFKSTTGV